jgi:RNA recognition motif-containing protein
MSIIIRLQNLPWSANSLDIRRFFQALSIPDGGVHIVGGDKGDAFIAFANDEDARQAMARDGGTIKDGVVKLMLSSRSEMKKVIEQARMATIALKASIATTDPLAKGAVKSDLGANTVSAANDYGMPKHSTNGSSVDSRAPNQIGAGLPGNGHLTGSHPNDTVQPMSGLTNLYPANGAELASLPPTAPTVPSDQWTVELRGLPFNIVPQEIQDFFRAIGLFVQKESIKILVDERGFTTGGAIVRMISQRDFDTALLLNGRFLGALRVDVMPLMMDTNHHMGNLHLPPNLPAFVPPAHSLIPNANTLSMPSAVPAAAYQQMPPLTANLSAQIGSTVNPSLNFHIDRKPTSEESFPQSDDRRRPLTLFMKGIPFGGCNEADIKQFFAPIVATEVLVLFEKSGKPSGDAYVEFIGEQNFEAAMGRNRKYMGHRYIELFPVTRNEMRRARTSNPSARAPTGTFRGAGRGPPPPRRTHCIQVTGLPPTVGNRDLTEYFAQFEVPPFAVHIMLKADGLNAGEAFIEFVSADQQRKALRRDGQLLSGCRLTCQPVAYELMQNIVGLPERRRSPSPPTRTARFRGGRRRIRSQSRSRSRSRSVSPSRSRSIDSREEVNGDRSAVRRPADNQGDTAESTVVEGTCLVQMDNIPARALDDDLCAFLEEFAVQRSQIRREPVTDGQPAGAAYIEFPSVQVAERAIRLKDRKYLIGRCISLKRI